MGKTVKNTGGVAALQKMPKNYENARQLITDCHRFKVGEMGGFESKEPKKEEKNRQQRLFEEVIENKNQENPSQSLTAYSMSWATRP